MSTYTVDVTRDGKWWMISIPTIDGLTQARRLSDIEAEARSYIVVDQDIEPSTVRIAINSIKVGDVVVSEQRAEIIKLRETEAEIHTLLTKLTSQIAHELADAEVPVRDIGEVLGVSYQRAHQLVSE